MGTKINSNYSDLLTFTRASKGHALRPVSYGDELVTNGTFDTDTSGWTAGNDAALSVSSNRLRVGLNVTDYATAGQGFSTVAGKIYRITLNSWGSNQPARWRLGTSASNNNVYQSDSSTGDDVSWDVVFVAQSSTTHITLYANSTSDTGYAEYDNISVKEVTFDQPDGTLTLFEHPNNIPRVEYDADGNRLGLLVEEARTNLILNSSDFSVGSWTKSSSSISAATNITAPDGTTNSFKLIEDSSTNAHRVQGAQAVGGTTSTMSCFMKKAERSWGNINFAGLTQGQAWFDLENGVLGTVQTAVTASIEDYGNGWYRCSVTATPTSAATTDIKVANNDESVSYTGDGTSGIYIFGAQTEAGSFPTSYIKSNSGSTTTRSADVASIPVSDFGYNDDAGSVVVEATRTNPSGGSQAVVATGHGGRFIYTNSGGIRSFDGTTVLSAKDVSTNVPFKAASSFNLNGQSLTADGDTVSTGSFDGSWENNGELGIGAAFSGSSPIFPFTGYIKSIKYYPRRLTNAQIQALTEPRSTPTLSLTFDGLESSYTENYIHG